MNVRAQEIASALPSDLDSLPRLRGFRLRGIAMTRLETFIDATLAFAITMLVIAAQQIPDDIETLLAAFKNVPAFVASVANKWKFMVVATAIARRPESRVPAAHYNHCPHLFSTPRTGQRQMLMRYS